MVEQKGHGLSYKNIPSTSFCLLSLPKTELRHYVLKTRYDLASARLVFLTVFGQVILDRDPLL